MSCAITTGYTKGCRDNRGGIKTVYLTELENIASFTEATGEITAMALETGKQFFEYEQIKHTSSFTAPIQTDTASGTLGFQHQLNLFFNKGATATRNQIMLLAQNNLVAIVEDNNGVLWVLGLHNGLNFNSGQQGTGTALTGERNGYDLVLDGMEPELPVVLESSLLAALLLPAA